MAFVYRPVVTKDGKRRRARFYWAQFPDSTGEDVRRPLRLPNGQRITDRRVAEAELRNLLNRNERRAVGLIDADVENAAIPFRVLIAGYIRHLRAQRRSVLHVRKSLQRIKWIGQSGSIERIADLNERSISAALAVLSARNRAPKTINEYRAALHALCEWAMTVNRVLTANPVKAVPVHDVNGDIRKVRRALTQDEAARLLAASGPRALWYKTALGTGLRVGELAAFEWRDLECNDSRPAIRLRADTTKSKRADVLPLRSDLAVELAAAKPPFARPTDRVFPTTPTHATFRRDCDRAGIPWQADDRGRTLDRHSLRTTFITWLSVAGVDPRTAQDLARHTDLKLTMRNYTDPRQLDLWGAVERLPAIRQPAVARKTGTDDVVLPVVLNSSEGPGNDAHHIPAVESATRVCGSDSQDFGVNQNNSLSELNGGGGNRMFIPVLRKLPISAQNRGLCVVCGDFD